MLVDSHCHLEYKGLVEDQDAALDRACLVEESGDALSHDNLFHTVLGLMDVETAVYEPALDLTTPCRDPDAGNTSGDTEEPRA